MRLVVFLMLSLWFRAGIADVVNIRVDSFSEIDSIYRHKIADPTKTLLVFDIDDTLLTMSQPLGSVAWWDWQSDLLNNEKDSSKLVAHNMQDLAKVQNVLFQLIKMNPTDEFVVPFLKDASEQGASLMGLTARGSEQLSVTQNQLTENGFVDSQNQLLFNTKAPKLTNQSTPSSGGLNCTSFTRYVSYYHGIVFLDGEDKGQALLCILNNSKKTYDTILYVDDAARNVKSVEEAFSNQSNIKVYNVLYTRENDKEQMFLHTTTLQVEADNQWKNIKAALEQNIKNLTLI